MSQIEVEHFLQHPEEETKLNEWIFERVSPFLKGRILEIGSGSGLFSSFLMEKGVPIHLSDPIKANRDKLRLRFSASPKLKAVHKLDLLRPDFEIRYESEISAYSAVIALNIMEYGFREKTEFENARMLLKTGGHLIIAVPSQTVLFPGFEEDLQELKKNNQKYLNLLLPGFEILKTRYFRIQDSIGQVFLNRMGLSIIVVARKI